jgi:hypothetical protein
MKQENWQTPDYLHGKTREGVNWVILVLYTSTTEDGDGISVDLFGLNLLVKLGNSICYPGTRLVRAKYYFYAKVNFLERQIISSLTKFLLKNYSHLKYKINITR